MLAIDTNILVRIVTNDDAAQARRAQRLIAGGEVWVPKTVILESEWVLRAAYGLERGVILEALRRFLSLGNVTVEDAQSVWSALDDYAAGLDLADALHIRSSSGAARFATFDKSLLKHRRSAGPRIVEP